MYEEYNDVVTVPEMCQMLLIGINNAYKLLESGKIKGFRNGRTWRIPKIAVEEYLYQVTGLKK